MRWMLIKLREANAMVKAGNSMKEANIKSEPIWAQKLLSGTHWNIKFVHENHFVRAYVPTGVIVEVNKIFSQELRLKITNKFMVLATHFCVKFDYHRI